MSTIDYSDKIPNNVNLSSDKTLQRALEHNTVVLPDRTNADVLALAADELQGAVQVFHVRSGRITGQRGFMVERTLDLTDPELMEQALLRFYGDADPSAIPREVLVSEDLTRDDLSGWLTDRAQHPFDQRARVAVPGEDRQPSVLHQDSARAKLREGQARLVPGDLSRVERLNLRQVERDARHYDSTAGQRAANLAVFLLVGRDEGQAFDGHGSSPL